MRAEVLFVVGLLFVWVALSSARLHHEIIRGKPKVVPHTHHTPSEHSSLFKVLSRRTSEKTYHGKGYSVSTKSDVSESWLELFVGTPPQSVHVQIDTGSSFLAVPASKCSSCAAQSDAYNVGSSKSGKIVKCSDSSCSKHKCLDSGCYFNCTYGDKSSIAGVLVNDVFSFSSAGNGSLSVKAQAGYIQKENGIFSTDGVGGILGLAFNDPRMACQPNCVTPLFDRLVEDKKVDDIFSMFLGQNRGQLTLGGINDGFIEGNIKYTPLSSESYYAVKYHNVKVNGKKIDSSSPDLTIVDTGTTLTLLASPIYDALRREFQKNHCDLPGVCDKDENLFTDFCLRSTKITDDQLKDFPTLTVEMDGLELTWTADHYMIKMDSTDGGTAYCMGIQDSHSDDLTILGDTLLRGYYLVFDRKNKRVGFGQLSGGSHIYDASTDDDGHFPTWGIVVICVAGAVVGVAVLLVGLFAFMRYRSRQGYEVIGPS